MAASGPVPTARAQGRGPTIWLAGSPDDLKEWMPLGIAGIVTNTVVLNQYAKQYGSVISLIEQYLALTDKPIVVEIDGHCVEEFLEVGQVFTNLSEQIILKIPCNVNGLKAFSILKDQGVETFCTTVFSLTQAVAVAQAGVDHILPFCEPVKEVGGGALEEVDAAVCAVDAARRAPRRGVDVAERVAVDAAEALQVLGGELERRKVVGGPRVVDVAGVGGREVQRLAEQAEILAREHHGGEMVLAHVRRRRVGLLHQGRQRAAACAEQQHEQQRERK